VSIYKVPNSKFWRCDVWVEGRKYSKSTRCTNRRDAETFERAFEAQTRARLTAEAAAGSSLAIADVAARYMVDVGNHHSGAANTQRLIDLVIGYFGETKALHEITQDSMLDLIRWRRGHKVGRGSRARPISTYTINDTVEQVKKLFTYAKTSGARFADEPKWRELWLDEAKRPPRELSDDESVRLEAAIMAQRPDYWPLFEFARATAKRKTECMTLEWSMVHWDRGESGEIELKTKGVAGGKTSVIEISPAIRAILWPLQGDHPVRVFTFVAERTIDKVIKGHRHVFVKGERYPITRDGLRRVWDGIRAEAGLLVGSDRFRFHDLRHDTAKKALRAIGSADGYPIVQKMLDHADITTTLNIYGAQDRSAVATVIEKLAQERISKRMQKRDKNHPKNHPSGKMKAG
jgi:integrase